MHVPTLGSSGTPAAMRHRGAKPADVAEPVLAPGKAPYVLSLALALLAAGSSAASLLVPDVLLGEPVSQGNLRGTAVVVLLVGVPTLVAAIAGCRHATSSTSAVGTEARWLIPWLGSLVYLTYQGVLFCFATPMNRLFLGYVAWLGCGAWSLGVTALRARPWAVERRTDSRRPMRLVAGTVMGFAALNGLAWIGRIVPSLTAVDPGVVLSGSGMLTSPVWVQDLALWIPAAFVFGGRMWRRRDALGAVMTCSLLAFYVIECVSIASDQWWGAQADASRPDLAATSMVIPFLVAALLSLAPLTAYLRRIDRKANAQ